MIFLAVTVLIGIVSFLCFRDQRLFDKLKFHPLSIKENGEWYRFFSHVLVHASWGHLLINLFVFYNFGGYVLQLFMQSKGPLYGQVLFAVFLLAGAFFSSLKAYYKHSDNPAYAAVGASGVVAATLFAFIIFEPLNGIYLFFIPIPIPAFIFGALYLVYEYVMDKQSQDRIAHDAHFFGAIFGVVFTFVFDSGSFLNFFTKIADYLF